MATFLLVFSLVQALTVRGTVWEPGDKPVANAIVTVAGPDGTMETTSGKDGSFQFKISKPGDVQLTASRGGFMGRPSTIHVEKDMDGIGIVLRPVVNSLVLGSVKVESGQPLPSPLPKVVIKYTSGSVAGRFDLSPTGLFFFSASPVEFNVALEGLKEPYFVKSMMFGDQDLMKNPMKLNAGPVSYPVVILLGIRK
jgi:Carboxypeptidase regulatory-like domain